MTRVAIEQKSFMNMNYNYQTTIWRSIFAQMYKFLVENIFFSIFPNEFFMVKIIPEIHIFGRKYFHILMGVQWHSGRVLDSRPKGRGFEPHWRHCVVVLEQDTFILA